MLGVKDRFQLLSREVIDEYKEAHFKEACKAYQKYYENVLCQDFGFEKEDEENYRANTLKSAYHAECVYRHPCAIFGTDIDLYDTVSCLQGLDHHEFMIITLGEDHRVLDRHVFVMNEEKDMTHYQDDMFGILSYLVTQKEAYYFITVHNHPHYINASPTVSDDYCTMKLSSIGNLMGIKMIDACIITDFDFYSKAQYQDNHPETPRVIRAKLSKKIEEDIFQEDFLQYHIIHNMLNGD